jgi:tetratricopeptide (TPR) repeat protein
MYRALTHVSKLQMGLCAALAICLLSGCGGAPARYEAHLQRGQHYLASGNFDKASVEFRNAAQIQPKAAPALYFNGRVAEARNNIREAFAYYQAAIDADPKYAPARAGAGKMLVYGGQSKRALEVVGPALAEHPDDPDLLAVRAAARHQLKDEEAALADAERAAKLSPTNENALAVLAALYAESKDYPRAVALLSDAVERVPASVPLREVLTNLYLRSGQPEKAEEQMRKVVELRPMELAPRSQLAVHLLRTHKPDAAQRVLEDAVKALSEDKQLARADQAKLLLADFLSQQRSREQGEKALREFIAREPRNLDLRLGLGALLQRAGATADALAAYQEVVKSDGTGVRGLMARDRMAAIHVAHGEDRVARKLVTEVLQNNPRDDDALILRSTLEMRQGDATGAIADLRAVLRDQPSSVPLQRSLGAAYLAKGQTALAEETLRAAMQGAPRDASPRIDLAELLARTSRAAQGVTLLEESVKLLPDNVALREALTGAYLAVDNLQSARAAAQELKTRQPQSAAGFYYAGLVAAREQHLDEARSELEGALTLQPDRLDALTALVRVQMAQGKSDAAIHRVQTALERDPNNLRLLNMLGGVYLDTRDFNHAADLYSRVSALAPALWQPHRNLALARLGMNDPQAALGEYRAALKLAPAEAGLVADAASLYEKQGHIDEAIAGYEALYRGNPQAQQFAANNLAMLLVTYRKDSASLDRARDLTSSFATSNNGDLLDTVGWVRFKRGEYRDALPILERALQQAPGSKVIRFHLAMTEMQLGLRDRARTNLESALEGAEQFQGADEARVALAVLKTRA